MWLISARSLGPERVERNPYSLFFLHFLQSSLERHSIRARRRRASHRDAGSGGSFVSGRGYTVLKVTLVEETVTKPALFLLFSLGDLRDDDRGSESVSLQT